MSDAVDQGIRCIRRDNEEYLVIPVKVLSEFNLTATTSINDDGVLVWSLAPIVPLKDGEEYVPASKLHEIYGDPGEQVTDEECYQCGEVLHKSSEETDGRVCKGCGLKTTREEAKAMSLITKYPAQLFCRSDNGQGWVRKVDNGYAVVHVSSNGKVFGAEISR